MKFERLTWHPYPEDKPKESGFYRVKIKFADGTISKSNAILVYYDAKTRQWDYEPSNNHSVIMWSAVREERHENRN